MATCISPRTRQTIHFPFQDNDNTGQVITLLHEACTRTLTIPEQQVNLIQSPDPLFPCLSILLTDDPKSTCKSTGSDCDGYLSTGTQSIGRTAQQQSSYGSQGGSSIHETTQWQRVSLFFNQ